MSELKVYIKPLKRSITGHTIVGQAYYLKSEADKVIAEKDKEITDLEEKLNDTFMISRTCRKWICLNCSKALHGLRVVGSEPPMLLMEKNK